MTTKQYSLNANIVILGSLSRRHQGFTSSITPCDSRSKSSLEFLIAAVDSW